MAGSLLGCTALLLLCVLCTAWVQAQNDCRPPPRREREELAGLSDKGSYSHGEQVVYNCRPGYIKLGRFQMRCNNGRWEEVPPYTECQKKSCGHPGDIQFGSFEFDVGNEFSFGASVLYHCEEGYKMLNYRECRVDGWRNVPRCEKIECPQPQILNGNFEPKKLLYNYKELINILCEDGHQGIGISVCTAGGWQPPPACLSKLCEYPHIQNGQLYYTERPTSFPKRPGYKLYFMCNNGFLSENKTSWHVSYCTTRGWNPEPKCFKITCEPPNIAHGSVRNSKAIYQDGEQTQISCDDGYKPADRDEATCTRDGWNTSVECIAKLCEYPHIQNGGLYYKERPSTFPKRQGYELNFICNNGFLPENKNSWHVSYCTSRGWNPEPKCFKKCDLPRRIQHGALNYYQSSVFIEGNELSYRCDRGYVPENPQTTITCTKNGWSPTPSCVTPEITCGEPPVVANGDIVVSGDNIYLPGRELHYHCHKDFEIFGRNTIRCENKAWTKPPTCEDVRCPPPPDILHGRLQGNKKPKYLPNERVRYQCDRGYYISGSPIITCLKKQWSEAPQCRVVAGKCGRPPSIENGDIIDLLKEEYNSGERVTYKCQRFYTMEGNAVVSCQSGHWSETPSCIVPCTASEQDMEHNNIRLKWSWAEKLYLENGNTAEFTCKWGYRPAPSSPPFRAECVNGAFEYPQCI